MRKSTTPVPFSTQPDENSPEWCWKSRLAQSALAVPKWARGEPNDARGTGHEDCGVFSVKEMGLVDVFCGQNYSCSNCASIVVCELDPRTIRPTISTTQSKSQEVHLSTSAIVTIANDSIGSINSAEVNFYRNPLLIPLIVCVFVTFISSAFAITACICIIISRKSKLNPSLHVVQNSTRPSANRIHETNSTYESSFTANTFELTDYSSLPPSEAHIIPASTRPLTDEQQIDNVYDNYDVPLTTGSSGHAASNRPGFVEKQFASNIACPKH